MTITQEYHQGNRYGAHNYNNHEASIGGGTPLHKHQDFINEVKSVIPKRMSNTEKMVEFRKIHQRFKENTALVLDNPHN